jgi:hypothetical protein
VRGELERCMQELNKVLEDRYQLQVRFTHPMRLVTSDLLCSTSPLCWSLCGAVVCSQHTGWCCRLPCSPRQGTNLHIRERGLRPTQATIVSARLFPRCLVGAAHGLDCTYGTVVWFGSVQEMSTTTCKQAAFR